MNVTRLPIRRTILDELVADIKEAVYNYKGEISVTEAIGALELAKIEIYNEQVVL